MPMYTIHNTYNIRVLRDFSVCSVCAGLSMLTGAIVLQGCEGGLSFSVLELG